MVRGASALLAACAASATAYSPKHIYSGNGDLWRASDVPSLRPPQEVQSPAARQISLLATETETEDPESTTYCIAVSGQTMVDDKWCVVSCNNVPPNCPGDLCDCVKGREAKRKVDKVKETLKKASEEGAAKEQQKKEEQAKKEQAAPQTVRQAVHQKELKEPAPGSPEATQPKTWAERAAAPSPPKSAAELKYEEEMGSWAVRDAPPKDGEAPGADNTTVAQDAKATVAEPEVTPEPSFEEMVNKVTQDVAAKTAAQEALSPAGNATQEAASNAANSSPDAATDATGVAQDAASTVAEATQSVSTTSEATGQLTDPTSASVRDADAGLGPSFVPTPDAPPTGSMDEGLWGSSDEGSTKHKNQQMGGVTDELGTKTAVSVIRAESPHTEESATANQESATASTESANANPPTANALFSDMVDTVTKDVAAKSAAKEQAKQEQATKEGTKAPNAASVQAKDPALDADGADLTTNSTSLCPKCGFPAASPDVPNCCSKGGAWEGTCSATPTDDGSPTWEDGFNACRSLHAAKLGLGTKKKAPSKKGSGASAKGGGMGLQDGETKAAPGVDIPTQERKCDSEREEWCDGAAAASALSEGADPEDCVAASGAVGTDDEWCVLNCGFTPPNCPKALCTCESEDKASSGKSKKKEADTSSLNPFAKAFERHREEGGEAQSVEKWVKKMKAKKIKEAEDAKKAEEAEAQPATAATAANVPKKTDKEIYLETCDKNPYMAGCPTCEEAPDMPHCGLNSSSWQDVSGLPKGANPASCEPVGDMTKDWCVMNCGGTPPNCPSALCKCRGPGGEEPAVAKSEPKEKDDPKAHCKDTGCRDAAPSELAEAAAAINEAAQPENQRSRQQATQQQEAAQSQSQQQQASPQAQDEQTQSQPAQSQQAEGAPAKTKKGCDWATMDCRIFDEQGEAQPQAKQARLEQVQPKQPEQAQAQQQDQASQRPHAQINDGLEPGFFPLPDSDSQPKEESHVTTDLLRIRRPRSGRHRRRHGPRVQQQQAEGDSMNAFGEENQEMQAEEDAEYKKAQRYR